MTVHDASHEACPECNNRAWRLMMLERVVCATDMVRTNLTREVLLYILANHESAESIVDALVAFHIGEPF